MNYYQYRNTELICDNIREQSYNDELWANQEYDKVFPDWREGDILYIGESKLEYPILENGQLREMTYMEKVRALIIELPQGQYYDDESDQVITVERPTEYLYPEWDITERIWKDKATDEEWREQFFSKINRYKAEVMENGFDFEGHQQKCREKDIALLGFTLQTASTLLNNEKEEDQYKKGWAFNDGDVVIMSTEDIYRLCSAGDEFVSGVYIAEAKLKAGETIKNFTKEQFIELVNQETTYKCYENKEIE